MVISFTESALRNLEEMRIWCMEQQGLPDVGTRLVTEVFQRVWALADLLIWDGWCLNAIRSFCVSLSIRRFLSFTGVIPGE